MYSYIIKNGTIIDGTGSPSYVADIAIKNGRIEEISPNICGKTEHLIDASGLMVSPGFIDNHSHSDMFALLEPYGHNEVEQGITTQITGNCGISISPYFKGTWEEIKSLMSEDKYSFLSSICFDCNGFMNYVQNLSFETNMAFYVGHGSIRGKVMDYSDAKPSEKQMQQMKDILSGAMKCGFLGMSTGLVYAPSVYADTDEIIQLCQTMYPYGGSYVSHIRGEGDTLECAVGEAIEIGKQSGVDVIISHLKVEGRQNEGSSIKILKMIDKANVSGCHVYADQYPFTAGGASLISQIPPKYMTKGNDILLQNLRSSSFRSSVEYSIFNESNEFESGIYVAGYDGCLVIEAPNDHSAVGKTLTELSVERNASPIDIVSDLLITSNGLASCAYICQNESDMLRILSHPSVMCGCDSTDRLFEVNTEDTGGDHPRSTGAMTQRLALIRDNKLASVEEAIRRITSLPARVTGIHNIGILKRGYRADICIFDYENIRCKADLINPYRRNQGICYVFVGGKVAVKDGKATGIKNGQILKRQHNQ